MDYKIKKDLRDKKEDKKEEDGIRQLAAQRRVDDSIIARKLSFASKDKRQITLDEEGNEVDPFNDDIEMEGGGGPLKPTPLQAPTKRAKPVVNKRASADPKSELKSKRSSKSKPVESESESSGVANRNKKKGNHRREQQGPMAKGPNPRRNRQGQVAKGVRILQETKDKWGSKL